MGSPERTERQKRKPWRFLGCLGIAGVFLASCVAAETPSPPRLHSMCNSLATIEPGTTVTLEFNRADPAMQATSYRMTGLFMRSAFNINNIDAEGWRIDYIEANNNYGFYNNQGELNPKNLEKIPVKAFVNPGILDGKYPGYAFLSFKRKGRWYECDVINFQLALVTRPLS